MHHLRGGQQSGKLSVCHLPANTNDNSQRLPTYNIDGKEGGGGRCAEEERWESKQKVQTDTRLYCQNQLPSTYYTSQPVPAAPTRRKTKPQIFATTILLGAILAASQKPPPLLRQKPTSDYRKACTLNRAEAGETEKAYDWRCFSLPPPTPPPPPPTPLTSSFEFLLRREMGEIGNEGRGVLASRPLFLSALCVL